MRILLIALGNPLRGDDGVAHAVISLLKPRANVTTRAFLQLTPEVAAELAGFDLAVFVDADVHATQARIEPIGTIPSRPPLTHWGDPIAIVNIARALFGFTGQALVCRIPAADFSAAAPATETAAEAANLLESLLESLDKAMTFGRSR